MNDIKLIGIEIDIKPHTIKKEERNPLHYCCNTCKNLPECSSGLRKIWKDSFDVMCEKFECDFYRRKNSGAFRRKCRKFKKQMEG